MYVYLKYYEICLFICLYMYVCIATQLQGSWSLTFRWQWRQGWTCLGSQSKACLHEVMIYEIGKWIKCAGKWAGIKTITMTRMVWALDDLSMCSAPLLRWNVPWADNWLASAEERPSELRWDYKSKLGDMMYKMKKAQILMYDWRHKRQE